MEDKKPESRDKKVLSNVQKVILIAMLITIVISVIAGIKMYEVYSKSKVDTIRPEIKNIEEVIKINKIKLDKLDKLDGNKLVNVEEYSDILCDSYYYKHSLWTILSGENQSELTGDVDLTIEDGEVVKNELLDEGNKDIESRELSLGEDNITIEMSVGSGEVIDRVIYETKKVGKKKIELTVETLKRLIKVDEELREKGYRLKLLTGYIDEGLREKIIENIEYSEKNRDNSIRSHKDIDEINDYSRGEVVDVRITDLTGNTITMPTEYLDYNLESNISNVTEITIMNEIFGNNGFRKGNYWWRYDKN